MSYGVNAPQGLQLVSRDGAPYSGATLSLPLQAAYAANIFIGTPLMMDASGCPVVYLPVAGANVQPPILGVAIGFNFILPNDLNPAPKSYWPANTVVKTGTTAYVTVATDPEALWSIQLAAGAINNPNYRFNNVTFIPGAANVGEVGSGNAVTGLSTAAADTPVASGTANNATFPLKIWDFDTSSTLNAATPLYQNIIVKFNNCASRAGTAAV